MRYFISTLIVIALLLFGYSSTASAKGWMSEGELAKCSAGQPYAVKVRSGGAGFHKIPPGFSCEYFEPKDLQVDDLSKPLYGSKLNVSGGFADLATCMLGIAGYCEELEPDPGYVVQPVCAEEESGGTFEIYCIAQNPQSYEQKTVRRLLEDATKKAAYDAAQALNASDSSSRSAKRIARRSALKACVAVLGSESPGIVAIKNCVRRLVREVMEKELSTDEL